jgi:hypothetical protein
VGQAVVVVQVVVVQVVLELIIRVQPVARAVLEPVQQLQEAQ